jgi:8-oxo-dGTP diphosphatase
MEKFFTQTFGVVGAIIEKGGKILLVRENQPGEPDDGKWSHPAGWIDLGENPIEAVEREVKEETGYDFKPTHFLGVYSLVRRDIEKEKGASPHPIKLIFIGEIKNFAKENLLGDTRGTKWFGPEEIFAMDRKTLREDDIKQMVKDCFSGRQYPLEIINHYIQTVSQG